MAGPGFGPDATHRAADRQDRGDGSGGGGQRGLRQQDRRDRGPGRAGSRSSPSSAREYEEDVDLLRLASDLVLDAIIEADELRAELVLPAGLRFPARPSLQRAPARRPAGLSRVSVAASSTPIGPSRRRQPFWRRFPVWFPFAVFAVSRLVVWVAATYLSRYQIPLPIGTANIRIFYPTPADPGYNAVMTGWDGQWYRVIADTGYPAALPRVGSGGIDMNPWAFFPVFPMTVGLVMKVTGLALHRRRHRCVDGHRFRRDARCSSSSSTRRSGAGRRSSPSSATCFFIASPAFSASYTESTALLGVVTVLMADAEAAVLVGRPRAAPALA